MEYDDVYEDLPAFDLSGDIEKLQKENDQLQLHIQCLEKDIEKLCSTITEMKKTQENLTKNISELYNTAKNEIARKDQMIADLRSQLDDIILRRSNAPYVKRGRDSSPASSESNMKRMRREDEERYSRDKDKDKYFSHHRRSPSWSTDKYRASRHRDRSRGRNDRYNWHSHGSNRSRNSSKDRRERGRSDEDKINPRRKVHDDKGKEQDRKDSSQVKKDNVSHYEEKNCNRRDTDVKEIVSNDVLKVNQDNNKFKEVVSNNVFTKKREINMDGNIVEVDVDNKELGKDAMLEKKNYNQTNIKRLFGIEREISPIDKLNSDRKANTANENSKVDDKSRIQIKSQPKIDEVAKVLYNKAERTSGKDSATAMVEQSANRFITKSVNENLPDRVHEKYKEKPDQIASYMKKNDDKTKDFSLENEEVKNKNGKQGKSLMSNEIKTTTDETQAKIQDKRQAGNILGHSNFNKNKELNDRSKVDNKKHEEEKTDSKSGLEKTNSNNNVSRVEYKRNDPKPNGPIINPRIKINNGCSSFNKVELKCDQIKQRHSSEQVHLDENKNSNNTKNEFLAAEHNEDLINLANLKKSLEKPKKNDVTTSISEKEEKKSDVDKPSRDKETAIKEMVAQEKKNIDMVGKKVKKSHMLDEAKKSGKDSIPQADKGKESASQETKSVLSKKSRNVETKIEITKSKIINENDHSVEKFNVGNTSNIILQDVKAKLTKESSVTSFNGKILQEEKGNSSSAISIKNACSESVLQNRTVSSNQKDFTDSKSDVINLQNKKVKLNKECSSNFESITKSCVVTIENMNKTIPNIDHGDNKKKSDIKRCSKSTSSNGDHEEKIDLQNKRKSSLEEEDKKEKEEEKSENTHKSSSAVDTKDPEETVACISSKFQNKNNPKKNVKKTGNVVNREKKASESDLQEKSNTDSKQESGRVLRSATRKTVQQVKETETVQSNDNSPNEETGPETKKPKLESKTKCVEDETGKKLDKSNTKQKSVSKSNDNLMSVDLSHDGAIPCLHIPDIDVSSNKLFDLSNCEDPTKSDSKTENTVAGVNKRLLTFENYTNIMTSTPACDSGRSNKKISQCDLDQLREDLNMSSFEQSSAESKHSFTEDVNNSHQVSIVSKSTEHSVSSTGQTSLNSTGKKRRRCILTMLD